MKTERRHELEENQLADYLQRLWIDVQRYSTAIVGTLVALAVVAGAYLYLTSQSAANKRLSWEQYQQAVTDGDDEALLKLAQRFPDLPAGQWAQVTLADRKLITGVSDLFSNRVEAQKALDDALKLYTNARGTATREQRDLAERALLGQARSEEALGKVNDAIKSYQLFAQTYADSPYLIEVEWRLKSLESPETKKFYDWFAKYQPAPSADSNLAPGVGLDQLPQEPPSAQLIESIEKAAGLGPGVDQPTTSDTPPTEPPLQAPPNEGAAPPTAGPPTGDAPAAEPAAPPATEPAAPPAAEPMPQP